MIQKVSLDLENCRFFLFNNHKANVVMPSLVISLRIGLKGVSLDLENSSHRNSDKLALKLWSKGTGEASNFVPFLSLNKGSNFHIHKGLPFTF